MSARGRNTDCLYLEEPFRSLWRDRDVFREVRGLQGRVYRDMPGRRTIRFRAGGHAWFLKYHSGTGWPAVLGDWLRGRRPVTGADNELYAIRAARAAGVDTLTEAAFAARGRAPAHVESFLVTADLEEEAGEPLIDLETLCSARVRRPLPLWFRRQLLHALARISARLHGAAITHRDYYLCHFLIPRSAVPEDGESPNGRPPPRPVLIDLHRALLRPRRLQRWVEKDLAGVWFSAAPAALTPREQLRFLRTYSGGPLRETLPRWNRSLRRIRRRVTAMRQREQVRQQRYREQLLVPPDGSLLHHWMSAERRQRDAILHSLAEAVVDCHKAGWLPVDRALRDVRESDDGPGIELTGAMRLEDTLAPEQARRANLADFLSWFPRAADPWLAGIARTVTGGESGDDFSAALAAARQARWQRIAAGLYRNTADVERQRLPGAVLLKKRRLTGIEWQEFAEAPDQHMTGGRMIKDGDSTTVVALTLGGRSCIVKRYNLLGASHRLRRAVRPSRAWRHWYHAHRLLALGVQTPEPLLVLERRLGPLRREAWLVTEAESGADLLTDRSWEADPDRRDDILGRFRDWFVFLRENRVNHGDMKLSNFIASPAGLIVLDLDGMRWRSLPGRFQRGLERDRRRFLRNWEHDDDMRRAAQRMLDTPGSRHAHKDKMPWH